MGGGVVSDKAFWSARRFIITASTSPCYLKFAVTNILNVGLLKEVPRYWNAAFKCQADEKSPGATTNITTEMGPHWGCSALVPNDYAMGTHRSGFLHAAIGNWILRLHNCRSTSAFLNGTYPTVTLMYSIRVEIRISCSCKNSFNKLCPTVSKCVTSEQVFFRFQTG